MSLKSHILFSCEIDLTDLRYLRSYSKYLTIRRRYNQFRVFHESQWGFDVPLLLMFQSREGILLCTGQEGTGRARDNGKHVKGRKKSKALSHVSLVRECLFLMGCSCDQLFI
jgi:hypothetical protein